MSELMKLARKHKPVKLYLRTFLEAYERIFEPIRNEELKILEFGVGGFKNTDRGGGSLWMWSEYFPNAFIVGVDVNEKNIPLPDNVSFERGSQTDGEFLDELVKKYGPFDIVIDDASHVTKNTIFTFNELWPHTLRFYSIEDLHMKKAKGTKEYFEGFEGVDMSTDHMCIVKKEGI